MKTREHLEHAAADDEKFGDISSARVNDDPMGCTSFGDTAESSAPENNIGDALLDQGAKCQSRSVPRRDLHINTHRWLTARRLSLNNAKVYLPPTTFFLGASVNRLKRGMLVRQHASYSPSTNINGT